MSDDKPKHKPQQKHTLSEVLKSLQDLIRTDLVTAAPSSASPAAAQSRADTAPLTPAEPDSFNQALDQLDEIITHNIIEPVERAKDTPPEPLLPEETLEIEWDDIDPPAPASSQPPQDTIEFAPAAPQAEDRQEAPANNVVELEIIQMETKSDSEPETIHLDAPQADVDSGDNVIDFEAVTDDSEVIELTAMTDDVAPDTIELPPESAAELAPAPDDRGTARTPPPANDPAPIQANPQRELFETHVAPPQPLETDHKAAPMVAVEKIKSGAATKQAPTPTPPPVVANVPPPATPAGAATPAQETPPPTQADGGDEIPPLTIDFDVTTLSATFDDATAAKTSQVETPPKPADIPRSPRQSVAPSEPTTSKTWEVAADAPHRAEKPAKEAKDQPARATEAPSQAPVQQDIPVLKEVANLEGPPSTPLPSPAQARDIAIRVIAKLNIERRKAGETALDIKTIEKLQQYLADALNKRTLNKPK